MNSRMVEVSPQAVEAIKREVATRLAPGPHDYPEAGGLLYGEIAPSSGVFRVRIDSIGPVPLKPHCGPCYRLSEVDQEAFLQAVRNRPGKIIGWYRSDAHSGHVPNQADRAGSALYFPERTTVFLICYPDEQRNIAARLCLWPGREQEQILELGIEPGALPASRPEAIQPAQGTRVSTTPPAPQIRAPLAALTGRKRAATLALGSALGVVAVAGWLMRDRVEMAAAGVNPVSMRPADLGMRVTRQGPAISVNWNRQAPEIFQAASATFRVVDDNRTRAIELTSGELRTGGILLAPGGDDLRMELEVHGPSGVFAQEIRVIGTLPESREAAMPATIPVAAAEKPLPPSPGPRPESIAAPPGMRDAGKTATPERQVARAFIRPEVNASPSKELAMPEPPALAPAQNAARLRIAEVPLPLPPRGQARPSITSKFVPARPIQSAQPSFRASSGALYETMRAHSGQDQEIDVEVTIDARGKVKAAKLVKTSGLAASLIMGSALSTAQAMRFEPATLNGRPIESQHVIRFVLNGKTQ